MGDNPMTFWEIQKIIPSETLGKRAVEVGVCSSREHAERLMQKMNWEKGNWQIGDYGISRIDIWMKSWSWHGTQRS